VIFVNGCFWHAHGCPKGRAPKSRLRYWKAKLDANCDRDKSNMRHLKALGWKVLTVWQCETRNESTLSKKLSRFLEDQRR
jgi:DNA mismatch endonuclease (patch repair protein)